MFVPFRRPWWGWSVRVQCAQLREIECTKGERERKSRKNWLYVCTKIYTISVRHFILLWCNSNARDWDIQFHTWFVVSSRRERLLFYAFARFYRAIEIENEARAKSHIWKYDSSCVYAKVLCQSNDTLAVFTSLYHQLYCCHPHNVNATTLRVLFPDPCRQSKYSIVVCRFRSLSLFRCFFRKTRRRQQKDWQLIITVSCGTHSSASTLSSLLLIRSTRMLLSVAGSVHGNT